MLILLFQTAGMYSENQSMVWDFCVISWNENMFWNGMLISMGNVHIFILFYENDPILWSGPKVILQQVQIWTEQITLSLFAIFFYVCFDIESQTYFISFSVSWPNNLAMFVFRGRLHDLFSQIEKEFEALYAENISCKCHWLTITSCKYI